MQVYQQQRASAVRLGAWVRGLQARRAAHLRRAEAAATRVQVRRRDEHTRWYGLEG